MSPNMLEISENDFRTTFECLFLVKPDLSTDEAYDMLKSTNFDVRKALLQLWEMVKPRDLHVPSEDLMGSPETMSDIHDMESENDIRSRSSSTLPAETCDSPLCLGDTIIVSTSDQGEQDQYTEHIILISSESESESDFELESESLPDVISIVQEPHTFHPQSSTPCSECKMKKAQCYRIQPRNQCRSRRPQCTYDNVAKAQDLTVKEPASIASKRPLASSSVRKRGSDREGTTVDGPTTVTKCTKLFNLSNFVYANMLMTHLGIGRLAGGLFLRTLLVCNGKEALGDGVGTEAAADVEDLDATKAGIAALIDVTCDPELLRRSAWQGNKVTKYISWVGSQTWKDPSGKIGYASVVIDGIVFKAGDYVTVRPSIEERQGTKGDVDSSESDMEIAAGIWFARIVYLFKDRNGDASAHMRWFEHGGSTILKETAGPRELFLSSECEDVSLGAIAGKIRVDYVGRDESRKRSGLGVMEFNFNATNHYFYRLFYSKVEERFQEARLHEDQTPEDGSYACYCCATNGCSEASCRTSVKTKDKDGSIRSMMHQGKTYSIHDFIYIVPSNLEEPYVIAQITKMRLDGIFAYMKPVPNSVQQTKIRFRIEVRYLDRYDDLFQSWHVEAEAKKNFSVRDNRRLYFTGRTGSTTEERLDGRCFVRHLCQIEDLDAYRALDDTFYVKDKVKASVARERNRVRLNDLESLDFCEFECSSDNDKSFREGLESVEAFMTHGVKLPAMDVFSGLGAFTRGLDQDGVSYTIGAVEWDPAAARTFTLNKPEAQMYNHDANVLLQRAIEEHAVRHAEVLLSYVDHYRPHYFLLENVPGLLKHRLGSTQIDKHNTRGGIAMGSAKFILRALTSIGYQAQFGVLQAGEFGTPQSRARVFFWGAAPGFQLPNFPEPTHVFGGPLHTNYSRRTRRSAPHRGVTVGEAITDLPAFDYKLEVPDESPTEKSLRAQRVWNIRQVALIDSMTRIGRDVDKYASPPLSEFQRALRRDTEGQSSVSDHYTMRWVDEIMIRILRIPMRPGANHMDLLEEHDTWCLRNEKSAAPRHNFYPDRYRRLDLEKPFQTCLTKIDPSGKNGTVLHPIQHRVLTVREQARSLGLPDSFKFPVDQPPRDSYKQIGNGVACQVARAQSLELRKVVIERWEKGRCVVPSKDRIIMPVDDGDEWLEID
ncbi:MAG: hypothetical protein M1818_006097 [Claussenomyces sp. TS43310]|nr:MAG: hypothetical protein M1818_006097 [Claussenomyces sp. TS43310]